MKKIVIFTGAGMSAESGIQTFRDSNGLWNNHKVEDVATPEGFRANPELVLNFYNERRAQLKTVTPNSAHVALAELEKEYDVYIITQNVDDLHERAGSTKVLHLHGELLKMCSVRDTNTTFSVDDDIKIGDLATDGGQLRPAIVWFGEQVPKIIDAQEIVKTADIFVVIGTSLNVYPAAGLLAYVPNHAPIFIIDKVIPEVTGYKKINKIQNCATIGVVDFIEELKNLNKDGK